MTRLHTEEFTADQLVAPPCPHFEECGACQLQHIKEQAYREWKETQIKQLIADNKLFPAEWKPSVFIKEGTRRRITVTVSREGDDYCVGFNRYHSHDVIQINDCLLLTSRISDAVKKIPDAIKGIVARGSSIDLSIQETDDNLLDCLITGITEQGTKQTGQIARLAHLCDFARVSLRKDAFSPAESQVCLTTLRKTSGALSVDLPPSAFLQPSKEGEQALLDAVMAALTGRKLGKKDKIADLFSGCGTFAGEILQKYSVHAAENDWGMASSLIEASKGNARITAECRDLFKEPISVRELRAYKAVIFDPPRSGAKEQCQKLAKSDVPLVVGISCNPSTFARDAKILIDGGYQFISAQIIDQFTWSTHAEIIGIFEK